MKGSKFQVNVAGRSEARPGFVLRFGPRGRYDQTPGRERAAGTRTVGFMIQHLQTFMGRALCSSGLATLLLLASVPLRAAENVSQPDPAEASEIGRILFSEPGFSNPLAGHRVSCASCHLFDERREERGLRGFCDFDANSRVPGRYGDGYVIGVRNSPTLFDVGAMPRLHFDGEFDSLPALVVGTISGRMMGWLPGEEDEALANAVAVLRGTPQGEGAAANPDAPSYAERLESAYGIGRPETDAEPQEDALIGMAARAMSEFMEGIRSPRNSPWDEFLKANSISPGPDGEGDAALREYARAFVRRTEELGAADALRHVPGFGRNELRGAVVFFSDATRPEASAGNQSAGNCFACHAPPGFTDHGFHNTGFSQLEFDAIHGRGSFLEEEIPGPAGADRPVDRFRGVPSGDSPADMDLGFWNFVRTGTSDLRREGETEAAFLDRMIATFKTPTLRNLAISDPYIHSGRFRSTGDVVNEYMRISDMARAGEIRSGDDELARVRLRDSDIAPLTAFLDSLNDRF